MVAPGVGLLKDVCVKMKKGLNTKTEAIIEQDL